MKKLFKASIFILMDLLLSACGWTSQSAPASVSSPGVTLAPTSAMTTDPSIEDWIQTSLADTPTVTATLVPTQTTIATIEVTPTQAYVPPTLIPTIDPLLVPNLLKDTLSVQTLEGVNGHTIRQITGWDHGFGAGVLQYSCSGFNWLDTNHLVLYPAGGELNVSGFGGILHKMDVAPQAVIINLETEAIWLPPVEETLSNCNLVYGSQELGILVNLETPNGTPTVSTYTYDGHKLASYTGQISDISPSGTKILFDDNTLIDLRTNKRITLDWSLEDYYEPYLSDLYWTYPEETHVYRCCYFYADVATGISHRFKRSDFQDTDGNHLDPIGLWFHQGEWIRNNRYFLVSWLIVDAGDVKYLPMLDPAKKLFYNVWEMAGISEDLTLTQTDVSPDGNYVWIIGWDQSYLVNLTTFESQHYRYQDPYTYTDVDWSADSKFVWFQTHDSDNKSTEFQILSISGRKLSPLPVVPLLNSDHWWQPTNSAVVYPAADKNALIFLDTSTMSYRELPFNLHKLPSAYGNVVYGKVVWSPNGEKLALVAEDGSVWQVDYPSLRNLEQLTASLPDVHEVHWSPDGNSIAFISGSDIYVVETTKK